MPASLYELRALWDSTFIKTYTAASDAAWAAGTAHKLPVTEVDRSKLRHEGIERKTLQQRMYGSSGIVPGLRKTSMQIGMPLGSGTGTTTPPLAATILGMILGGLDSPANATSACAANCTTTTITTKAAHGMNKGAAVLINGEVGIIATVPDTTSYTLRMALSAAPAEDAVIANSHTVYLDQSAAVYYFRLLGIGFHAEDQFQALGCCGPVSLEGLGIGQSPSFALDFVVPDWQPVPAAERDQLEPSAAPEGDLESVSGLGAFLFGDWSSTTRSAIESDEWKIDPGVRFVEKTDRNGLNGIGGFVRMPGVPSASFKTPVATDYGLHADFSAETAKQVLWQFGNVAGGTVAISMKAKLRHGPAPAEINDRAAQLIDLVAVEPTVASTPDNEDSSAIAFHWL